MTYRLDLLGMALLPCRSASFQNLQARSSGPSVTEISPMRCMPFVSAELMQHPWKALRRPQPPGGQAQRMASFVLLVGQCFRVAGEGEGNRTSTETWSRDNNPSVRPLIRPAITTRTPAMTQNRMKTSSLSFGPAATAALTQAGASITQRRSAHSRKRQEH